MSQTIRLTMAQALIHYLSQQYVARDGKENAFFAGVWGIFGHGNVAGIGQALQQYASEIRYYQSRNEQAQVHAAAAYAKHKNRLQTFACTSSIGPGATNMITGAALATVNRLPVLLLPGDIFAERIPAPVLQQIESEHSQDFSANDCFKPISRYWDRINRPEQLVASLPEAMRVLTSPADTGAVTLALPQDVQAEAFDYPTSLFEKRIWTIPRNRPDADLLMKAAEWIRSSKQPIIVAGGGVHYSEANEALRRFVEQTGIPIGETQAGKGALNYDHPLNLGALGVTGTEGANLLAQEADLIIGIGTRYSDFTSASKTAFRNPDVRFININVAEFDAYKHHALPLVGDVRATLAELSQDLGDYHTTSNYQQRAKAYNREWDAEVSRIYNLEHEPMLSQGEVIGMVNSYSQPQDVVLCAAGSLPGDLHKLWRTRSPRGYHLEYGYSCMGYEIAGGMGVAMAAPESDVYVMVGDGSYLMMNSEIVTMVQEGIKATIILIDNHGFASIGGLSKSVGSDGFGTKYRYRTESDHLDGETLPVDFAKNCESLGAHVIHAHDRESLMQALQEAKTIVNRPVCIITETDRRQRVGGYESWWDVPVAEVSENPEVRDARKDYESSKSQERFF
ncbi:3D-(3,5/4)-trihydroxycyclohexane-1,2-dione acylhydrolase (decyclizing) [Phototrophicus methaneseepsis]|uniref:3D-(3,5/4)-trihydroxycyclohexane-1,2-dione acylhydrolase (Decyclizing) n=1 Tax=Phototrophicus methaneseepsis TaxID=2710758 RepID=A0A7S8E6P8_9CHLR|nr:3D-(3,5/4)-trihydroxycyclohexane-1,2-dione acylhydrolase (decyclizing) [Phototrophicus methaneseepsis]QPC81369.1 3D-(3,5/4)-trihydroxycyclohexane-1,2-dione acylhydrolase (decyclizing) [Phototrophicus methaneseepsis]